MDKRGQLGIGLIITIAIALIAGLALYQASVENVSKATSTSYDANVVYALPALNSTIDLKGQEVIGTPTVANESTGSALASGVDYTIQEGVSSATGVKTIQLTFGPSISSIVEAGQNVNVTMTYGDNGYIDNAGGRSMAGLILIFAALALAVAALFPTFRSGVMNLIGR